MKYIYTILSLTFLVSSFSQTEYISYTATGKGVATTFVTDYHCLGINPANLGWREFEDKKITTGTSETSFSLYSDVLSRQTLRTSIKNSIVNKNLDDFTRADAIGYAKDFASTNLQFNFDNNVFGASFQGDKFGGIAFSIRTRATWHSKFNANLSDIIFNGFQSNYFDSLQYFDGIDTVLIANYGNLSPDSLSSVIGSQVAIPFNVSQLFEGSDIQLSWNREFHLGYGRKIMNLWKDKIVLYGGVGVRYIQGLGYMDFSVKDSVLDLVSAFSPGFDINYGLAALTNPSALAPNVRKIFRSPVGEGWGVDFGVNAEMFKIFHVGMSVTNIGQMTYTGNVYEAVDTLLISLNQPGLNNLNIAESVPDLIEESGLIKVIGKKDHVVKLPGTFRLGGSVDIGEIARFGIDLIAPFNDVPGSFNEFAWGVGGDIKIFKTIVLMAGFTGGAGYDNQMPIGINFQLKEGAYEIGISSRDAITFFNENKPTISTAFGFARMHF